MGTPSSKPVEIPDASARLLVSQRRGRLPRRPSAPPDRSASTNARIEGRDAAQIESSARPKESRDLLPAERHPPPAQPAAGFHPLSARRHRRIHRLLLDRRHVKIGMKNLSIAFPERSESGAAAHLARVIYQPRKRRGASTSASPGFFISRLRDRVRYERFHYWDEVAQKYPGKGMVVLSAHFGNFELMACAHAMHGYQINLIHHTQRFLAGDALMTFARERCGVRDPAQTFRGARGAEGPAYRRYGRAFRSIRTPNAVRRCGCRFSANPPRPPAASRGWWRCRARR